MAVRPLVNLERLTTAHVNSVDGSMTYESGVEYKANTTVSYNGSLYTANVDIADTDTDTPDAAPEKWSMTINAPDTGTSRDISALTTRVSAIENGIDGYYVLKEKLQLDVTASSDTYASLAAKAANAAKDVVDALADDEIMHILGLAGAARGSCQAPQWLTNQSNYTATTIIGALFASSNTVTRLDLIRLDIDAANVHWLKTLLGATPSYSEEISANTINDGHTIGLICEIYKKIEL